MVSLKPRLARVTKPIRRTYVALIDLRERLLDQPPSAMPAPRPDELFLCGLCMLSGIPTLFGQPPASVTDAVLWRPLLYVWALSIVIWPLIIIWTSLARWRGADQISAALVHRRASILLAATCGAYVIAVASRSGWQSAVTVMVMTGFAMMRLWRAYEMRRWLMGQRT